MQTVSIPSLVRIKPGVLDRVGIYLRREQISRVALLVSAGPVEELLRRMQEGLQREAVDAVQTAMVAEASFEQAMRLFAELPAGCQAIVGMGGGRALDTAKYVAFLAGLPYYAVPTSLSNDGYCSPRSSLTLEGGRKSLAARLPVGVLVDTEVCLHAPLPLWHSGVGDLIAKVTAILDWKLAFHERGVPVNDFAALLSDATVSQFVSRPSRDLEGMRLLGTALMLNGIAMEIAGSSRPASGSEHLISHALDLLSPHPRLHGLQVGLATYLVSHLHQRETTRIATLLDTTHFWDSLRANPIPLADLKQALRLAPTLKEDFFTILSTRDCLPEMETLLTTDPRLEGCVTSD